MTARRTVVLTFTDQFVDEIPDEMLNGTDPDLILRSLFESASITDFNVEVKDVQRNVEQQAANEEVIRKLTDAAEDIVFRVLNDVLPVGLLSALSGMEMTGVPAHEHDENGDCILPE